MTPAELVAIDHFNTGPCNQLLPSKKLFPSQQIILDFLNEISAAKN